MSSILKFVGFIWLLPMTILVWILYIFPLLFLKQIKFDKRIGFIMVFILNEEKNNWYSKQWEMWAGWSGPNVIIYKKFNKEIVNNILNHEYRHCMQQLVFGPLHYPLYVFMMIFIYIFSNKHPYFDNPFEVDARKYEREKCL